MIINLVFKLANSLLGSTIIQELRLLAQSGI